MAISPPDLDDASSNPILLYFLEGELLLLQHATQGPSAHFRQRIRLALADSATVGDTTIRWGAAEFPAHIVHVAPFLDDPYRSRFERDAATVYEFVLSDAVPGGVYKLSATVLGATPGDAPLGLRSRGLLDALSRGVT